MYYELTLVEQLHRENGLTIVDSVRYGRWRGRVDLASAQDIVIAQSGA